MTLSSSSACKRRGNATEGYETKCLRARLGVIELRCKRKCLSLQFMTILLTAAKFIFVRRERRKREERKMKVGKR